MSKDKTFTAKDIIDSYMNQVLKYGKRPKNVYAFAAELGMKESDFYAHFSSFEAIEKHIFKAFLDNTLHLLDQNAEYQDYGPQNKLLSFYYTFFEILKANRSYVVFALEEEKNKLKALSVLSELRESFIAYVKSLEIEHVDLKAEKVQKIADKGLEEWTWGQLLFTLKFWLDDTSPNFEKTDIFIEKSINTSFALLDQSTLSSIIDLGKFLFKEKVMAH